MYKLKKKEWPIGHSENDFECFGPAAEKDGCFSNTKIADLGCFTQDGKDTNKFYHGAIVKSRKTGVWYCYFEWGRTGGTKDFQFYQCSSEQEAQSEYEKQLHKKNDKRGEWYDHPTLGKILRAKKGKDCYLVRKQVVRSTGLPDAQRLTKSTGVILNLDKESTKLVNDLNVGTISYTKATLSTGAIPDKDAIDEGRKLIELALKSKKQKEIEEYTNLLYSKIPKKKGKNDAWLLDKDNAKLWLDDLDAFESALDGVSTTTTSLPFHLEYIPQESVLGKWLIKWIKSSTRHKHSYINGDIKIVNLWKIERDERLDYNPQNAKEKYNTGDRIDLADSDHKKYVKTNTALLFHGTRSVNVGGILSTGFRFPKELTGVVITGQLFGQGVYHANDYKKSVGYTSHKNSYWSGGSGSISGRKAFMLLNDVMLGNYYVPRYCQGNLPKGYDSFFAKLGKSGVQNDEFIVFDKRQIKQRYLVEFTI